MSVRHSDCHRIRICGANVFGMDLCGVASVPGISRTSINRLVAQCGLLAQDRNISVPLERRSVTKMQLPGIGSREKAGGDIELYL